MKTSKKNRKILNSKVALLTVAIIALVSLGGAVGYHKIVPSNQQSPNDMVLAHMILSAVNAMKKPAPVDPRTGDVYFPESGLYLPNPDLMSQITYRYEKGGAGTQPELSISTYPVPMATALYSSQNLGETFAVVPKLQSCARGIRVVYKLLPTTENQEELKHSVHLSNGRTAYIYAEKACPELNNLVDALQNIRAF